jgi:hypothetical protein
MVNVWGLIDDVQDTSRLHKRGMNDDWEERVSQQEHLQKMISAKTRRLRTLREQQARYGQEAPPSMVTEIEDLEAELEGLRKEFNVISTEVPKGHKGEIPNPLL